MRKLLFLLLLLPAAARAADLDVVRAQYIGYYTAAGASRATSRMQEALGALESVARENTAPGFLREDGSWSDINYDDTPDGGWSPWAHTQRLIVMAKAYQTPGQPYYKNAALRTQINAALAYTRSFYGANEIPTGNWWFWTMGIPLDLGPTLVLMRDEMDPNTYNDLVYAIALRIGNSPTARGLVGPLPTGENLVWSCFTHLTLGLLKDDPSMLTAVATAMSGVVRPTTAEGIKHDRSFHQHGAQLYTGGYGGSFAADVARHGLITRGTSYSFSSDALASFSDYVADGIAWSLYGDYFDVSVISREVARPSSTGFQGLAALLQAAEFASPRQNEIRSAAAKMLQSWRGTMTPELAGLAAQIETSGFPAAWPSGHRHYFASDYTIHRRPNWFASVKMFSTRTKSGERTNGENLLGARQSDGRFYLVLQGNEYFGRDIWPALDWTRLPGITVEQKADTASGTFDYGKRSYAGGTGDGQNGVSAMELAPLNSSLTARKSWFFFDDAIVFLTSGITATNPESRRDGRQSVAADERQRTARTRPRLGAARRRRLLAPVVIEFEDVTRVAQRHVGVPRRVRRSDAADEVLRHDVARPRHRARERDRRIRDRAECLRRADAAVGGDAADLDPRQQRTRFGRARQPHRRRRHRVLDRRARASRAFSRARRPSSTSTAATSGLPIRMRVRPAHSRSPSRTTARTASRARPDRRRTSCSSRCRRSGARPGSRLRGCSVARCCCATA